MNSHVMVNPQIAELLGLAKGIICDGRVSDEEALALREWLVGNSDVTDVYPGNQLADRLVRLWNHGVIDEHERSELTGLLSEIAHQPADTIAAPIPFDHPVPSVSFTGKTFAFVGTLASAKRAVCAERVRAMGGSFAESVTVDTSYLVVGLMGKRPWTDTPHGGDIVAAVHFRESGIPIAVISEATWLASMTPT